MTGKTLKFKTMMDVDDIPSEFSKITNERKKSMKADKEKLSIKLRRRGNTEWVYARLVKGSEEEFREVVYKVAKRIHMYSSENKKDSPGPYDYYVGNGMYRTSAPEACNVCKYNTGLCECVE